MTIGVRHKVFNKKSVTVFTITDLVAVRIIKKCLLCRQKSERYHSGAEGSLIRPLNNARYLHKMNGKRTYAVVMLRKGIDIAEGDIE